MVGDEAWVEALESGQGILVSGQRVDSARISAKEPIEIGPYRVLLSSDPALEVQSAGIDSSADHDIEGGLPDLPDPRAQLELLLSLVSSQDLRVPRREVLERVLAALLEAVGAERGFLFDCSGQAAARRLLEYSMPGADRSLPVSASLASKVAADRAPLLLTGLAVEDTPVDVPSTARLVRENLRSVIVFPLLLGSRLMGVLYLDSRVRLRTFVKKDVRLLEAVSRCVAGLLDTLEVRRQLESENTHLRQLVTEWESTTVPIDRLHVVGSPMETILQLAHRAARCDINVFVTGETGTGKEVIARHVHQRSARSRRPFVPINCGAMPEALIESELFGYRKGAFTGASEDRAGLFESAAGGTVFLDEVGDLPLASQVKLLRVLQERIVTRLGETKPRRVDFRLIAATLRDVKRFVAEGQFREDLLYRLDVLRIHMPSLRERIRDLPALVEYLLHALAWQSGAPVRSFSPEAMELLRSYDWPGNVRELRNVLERALAIEESEVLQAASLPAELRCQAPSETRPTTRARPSASREEALLIPDYGEALREFERTYFKRLVSVFGMNVAALARHAGLTRFTVYRKLAHIGLKYGEGERTETDGRPD